MKKVLISDVTLTGVYSQNLSFRERLDLAKRLDRIKADYIEVGPIVDSTESVLIKTMCSFLQNSAITCVATNKNEIDEAVLSLENAQKKRIQISLPCSIVQIEYNLHLKPQGLIDMAKELVSYAKLKCDDIELSLFDATRSEPKILNELISVAISEGVTAVTLVDNAGNLTPDEFEIFVSDLYKNIEKLSTVDLYIQATNRFKMSMAVALGGISSGACGIKTEKSAENATDIVAIFDMVREIGDKHGISINLSATDVRKIMTSYENNKKQVVKEENKEIEINSVESLEKILKQSGYDLSSEDLEKVFETYQNLRKKKIVGSKELDVIVATVSQQVPETYQLINYVTNSGNIITATTSLTLERDGMTFSGLSAGDGPIDASFRAIESIVGIHYELDEFSIGSITEGREAIGEAIVKLRYNGKLYSGVGISTDIIGASIRAYLSALNKIIYEEK